MSINIPTDLDLLAENALLGHVAADYGPLDTLLLRSNWLYATHAPPLVSVTPYIAVSGSFTAVYPITPSADGIDYTVTIVADCQSAVTLTWSLTECDTYGGTYTAVASSSFVAASSGPRAYELTTAAAFDPASAFLKLTVTMDTDQIKIHQLLIQPTKMTSVSASVYASGFIPHESADYEDASGAAIHTEHLNRAYANARAIVADRVQHLGGFMAEPGGLRFATGSKYVIVGVTPFPSGGERTITVRAKANDAGTAYIVFGQLNGDTVSLLCDGTARSGTLTVTGDLPVLFALVKASAGTDVEYLSMEYTPSIGSSQDLVAGAAPPARLEYLSAIDSVQLEAALTVYASPLWSFNWPALDVGAWYDAEWFALAVIPPGVEALRAVTVQSSNGTGVTAPAPIVWGFVDGFTTPDGVTFPPNISGGLVYPPSVDTVVAYAGETVNLSPSAVQDRLLNTTADREPQTMAVKAKRCIGLTLIYRQVTDIRDV
jgi:hypothetical protein